MTLTYADAYRSLTYKRPVHVPCLAWKAITVWHIWLDVKDGRAVKQVQSEDVNCGKPDKTPHTDSDWAAPRT